MQVLRKHVIGSTNDPYMIRWILFRIDLFGVYIHKFLRSDHDRALHDHPWPFISVILKTGYREYTPACSACDNGVCSIHGQVQALAQCEVSRFYRPGSVLFRKALHRHRVWLEDKLPVWSLVFVGRRVRKWGFWPNGKWCWWRTYNYATAICEDHIINDGGKD